MEILLCFLSNPSIITGGREQVNADRGIPVCLAHTAHSTIPRSRLVYGWVSSGIIVTMLVNRQPLSCDVLSRVRVVVRSIRHEVL